MFRMSSRATNKFLQGNAAQKTPEHKDTFTHVTELNVKLTKLGEDSKGQIRELEESNRKQIEQQKALTTSLSAFEQSHAKMNSLIEELRDESVGVKRQLSMEKTKVQNATDEVAALKALLAAKNKDLDRKDRSISELTKTNENLQFELRSLKRQLQKYRGAVETAQGALLGIADTCPAIQSACTSSTAVTAENEVQVSRPKCSTNSRATTSNVEERVESMQALGDTERHQIARRSADVVDTRSAAVAKSEASGKARARSFVDKAIAIPAKRSKSTEQAAQLYTCDKCEKSYSNFNSYKRHQTEDCGKPDVTCDGCKRPFRPRSYKAHVKRGSCRGDV